LAHVSAVDPGTPVSMTTLPATRSSRRISSAASGTVSSSSSIERESMKQAALKV